MKNNTNKFIAIFVIALFSMSLALTASADTTTAGYYDQFGIFHVYQTTTTPVNQYGYGSNYAYGNNQNGYYQNGYPQYGQSNNSNGYNSRPVVCGPNETYRAFDNICLPPSRTALATGGISGDGISTGSKTTNTTKTSTATNSTSYQASSISSLFGKKKTSDKLEISNIVIVSGPKNIYEEKSEVNCDVRVSWNTNLPSAGQVVYGPTSQPNVDTFNYPSTAPEGNSYSKTHQVKVGCLENMTYSLRVVSQSGGPNPQRAVSDEQTVFPIKIQTDIPTVNTNVLKNESIGGASALGVIGSMLMSPIVFIIILGAILFFVIRMLLSKKAGDSHGQDSIQHGAEPVLEIPHH